MQTSAGNGQSSRTYLVYVNSNSWVDVVAA